MLYIPDLFSAYTKGQEEAIDRNWNDLTQYEGVEQARTANDIARINLQAGMDDYGNNRAVSNALGSQAMIGEDLLKRMYRGDAANAEMNSDQAVSQYGALINNLPQLDNYNNALLTSKLGTGINNADTLMAQSNIQRELLPQTLGAYQGALTAQNTVANQNSTAAPLLNQGNIDNSLASQGLNAGTIATGVMQNQYTQQNLPLTNQVQVGALNQSLDQMGRVPVQQKQVERAQIAANIENLKQRILANAATVTQLQQQVQLNPAMASPYNSQIIRVRQAIAQDQATIAALEQQFGTSTQNTVQSLMGN